MNFLGKIMGMEIKYTPGLGIYRLKTASSLPGLNTLVKQANGWGIVGRGLGTIGRNVMQSPVTKQITDGLSTGTMAGAKQVMNTVRSPEARQLASTTYNNVKNLSSEALEELSKAQMSRRGFLQGGGWVAGMLAPFLGLRGLAKGGQKVLEHAHTAGTAANSMRRRFNPFNPAFGGGILAGWTGAGCADLLRDNYGADARRQYQKRQNEARWYNQAQQRNAQGGRDWEEFQRLKDNPEAYKTLQQLLKQDQKPIP